MTTSQHYVDEDTEPNGPSSEEDCLLLDRADRRMGALPTGMVAIDKQKIEGIQQTLTSLQAKMVEVTGKQVADVPRTSEEHHVPFVAPLVQADQRKCDICSRTMASTYRLKVGTRICSSLCIKLLKLTPNRSSLLSCFLQAIVHVGYVVVAPGVKPLVNGRCYRRSQ